MSESMTRIHQIAIHSSDLDRSVAFYRDVVGAEFIAKFDPPGLAFFRFGQTRLLLEKNANPATIYFWVDDMARSYQALRAKGVSFVGEPMMMHRDDEGRFGPPGTEEWMAFFSDPDGNTLAIASRVQGAGTSDGAGPEAPDQPDTDVMVNGHALTSEMLTQLEQVYRVRPAPGSYWYDAVSGLYGTQGQPAAGFMLPGHDLGPLNLNASAGNTGVLINGRNLPHAEWVAWSGLLGAPIQRGSYWLDAYGNAGYAGNPTPLVNLLVAAQQRGGGDNIWSTRFAAGNYDPGNQRGYVSVPGHGPVGYGF